MSAARCSDCREPIHETVSDLDAELLCKRCWEFERDEIEAVRAEERRQPHSIESHGPSSFGSRPGEIAGSAAISAIATSDAGRDYERDAILECERRRDRGFRVVVVLAGLVTMLFWAFCWWLDEYIESLPPL